MPVVVPSDPRGSVTNKYWPPISLKVFLDKVLILKQGIRFQGCFGPCGGEAGSRKEAPMETPIASAVCHLQVTCTLEDPPLAWEECHCQGPAQGPCHQF